jgi:hypothetical protein
VIKKNPVPIAVLQERALVRTVRRNAAAFSRVLTRFSSVVFHKQLCMGEAACQNDGKGRAGEDGHTEHGVDD